MANDPWQKSPSRSITPAEDRFAMAQALAEEIPGVEASRMEIDRGGPSYTVATVEALRAEGGRVRAAPPQIYLVIGADLVPDLGTWERSDDLRRLVTLAVGLAARRPQRSPATPRRDIRPPAGDSSGSTGPLVDVSSSAVRDAARDGAVESTNWCPPK